MARYTGPACRLCRRAGEKLFLKGERCYTPRCAVEKRRRPPGDTGQRRRRLSEWGTQLREKQKARQSYGVLERQFRGYFDTARKMPGVTGANLLQLLESRLDNVVYRLGFAGARQQARQWVLHGHFTVNDRKVSIPSYRVKPGQVVGWKESSKAKGLFVEASRQLGQRPVPDWLSLDKNKMVGSVSRLPESRDIDTLVDTRLIVEHYSR
ncbi:MAG: 30S ribosomal protein S4 [Chloroflexi bacterium]|nr:30S ribosomal protein S4 [Chloroflexota bacterium]|tara:strand:+ start:732 stop:1358 length:627 start_codon:yes stop_codon:yes gene_type:complete